MEVPYSSENNYNVNTTVMIAALSTLSMVIVLVTLFYMYTICILRRQTHRQATAQQNRLGSAQPPRTGLDPSVIAALPLFTIKIIPSNEMESLIECSVCLGNLEDGEIARTLPNCKHTFHAECVDKWFVSNSTCPICRAAAEPGEVTVVVEEPPLVEGTSEEGGGAPQPPTKAGGAASSRLSSFKRILSRERSSRRIHVQSSTQQEDGSISDLERQ